MPNDIDQRRFTVVMGAVFAVVVILSCADLIEDRNEGATALHVVVEACVAAAGAFGLAYTGRRFAATLHQARTAAREAEDLRLRLRSTQQEAEHWRREAGELLRGLGTAIEAQFTRWGLSAAEREVALLLLKGFSHHEIADLRAVGEPTTRQQAQAVYRKAGVSGRHDLAAFFLEDLLLPQPASPA